MIVKTRLCVELKKCMCVLVCKRPGAGCNVAKEAWFYIKEGNVVRQDNSVTEGISMTGAMQDASKDMVESLNNDAGLLCAGALPAFDTHDEVGQKNLLTKLTQEPLVVKKRKTRNKEKAIEVRPRTPREQAVDRWAIGDCKPVLASIHCFYPGRAAEVLKHHTKAKELALSLRAAQYGGEIKKDLSNFASAMEKLYTKLQDMANSKVGLFFFDVVLVASG